MKCTHPLVAIDLNQFNKNPKKDLVFMASIESEVDKLITHDLIKYKGHYYNSISISCGKCIACRINKASEWATRIMLEAKYHPKNTCWFVTLTYRDDALTLIDDVDEVCRPTLVPQELTKFIKDLRRYYQYHFNHQGIRFFAVGEYGDLYLRPHFHVIFFNLPIHDEKIFCMRHKQPVYHVPVLEGIWGKGFVECTPLTFECAAYVARYTQKKVNGFITKAHYGNLEPEFLRMSRNPGIARDYFDAHKDDIYTTDEINIIGRQGKVQSVKPAKYYDKLFDIEHPDLMLEIKQARLDALELANFDLRHNTDLSYSQYLANLDDKYYNMSKKLVRPLETERS